MPPPTRTQAKPRRRKMAKLKALPLRLEPGYEFLEPLLLLMVRRPRAYVSTSDAMRFVGCSHSQILQAIQAGVLDAHHNGLEVSGNGHWQIHPASLLRFVWERRGCKTGSTPCNAAYLLCHVLAHHLARPGKIALRTLLHQLIQRDEAGAQALGLSDPDPHASEMLLETCAQASPSTMAGHSPRRTDKHTQPPLL